MGVCERQRRKSSNSGTSGRIITARPPPSPFIPSVRAASSPLLSSKSRTSHGHAHTAGTGSAHAGSGHDEISSMTDVRRLEDMLSHNKSLLMNTTLCAQLPGGKANVEARNKAMKDRLEYLYAMHALSIHMQDKAALNDNDNPFIDEEDDIKPAHGAINTPTIVKKEEPISPKIEDDQQQSAAYSPQPQGGPSQLPESTTDDGSQLSSSPSNASPSTFHRHWKENIANRTTMVGKVGQLSMDESLSLLQLKANSRLNSQAAASQTSVEVGRSSHVKRAAMQSPRDVQRIMGTHEQEVPLPEEEEDYDWHTAGYYDTLEIPS